MKTGNLKAFETIYFFVTGIRFGCIDFSDEWIRAHNKMTEFWNRIEDAEDDSFFQMIDQQYSECERRKQNIEGWDNQWAR